MKQEIFDDRVVLHFTGGGALEHEDHSQPGLIVGYGKDRRIIRLTFLEPRKRGDTGQTLVIERYDPQADALDIELDEGAWHETEDSPLGFLIDFDDGHRIVALEFLGASRLFPEAALGRHNHAA